MRGAEERVRDGQVLEEARRLVQGRVVVGHLDVVLVDAGDDAARVAAEHVVQERGGLGRAVDGRLALRVEAHELALRGAALEAARPELEVVGALVLEAPIHGRVDGRRRRRGGRARGLALRGELERVDRRADVAEGRVGEGADGRGRHVDALARRDGLEPRREAQVVGHLPELEDERDLAERRRSDAEGDTPTKPAHKPEKKPDKKPDPAPESSEDEDKPEEKPTKKPSKKT